MVQHVKRCDGVSVHQLLVRGTLCRSIQGRRSWGWGSWVLTTWKYVGGIRMSTFFHSKRLLNNSASFTPWRIRLVSKTEGKIIFLMSLKQCDGLTWLTPTPVFYDRSTPLTIQQITRPLHQPWVKDRWLNCISATVSCVWTTSLLVNIKNIIIGFLMNYHFLQQKLTTESVLDAMLSKTHKKLTLKFCPVQDRVNDSICAVMIISWTERIHGAIKTALYRINLD